MKNYNFIHQIKNGRKGGGLSIFVLESFCYNTCKDLCTNNYETEVEIENKRSKNIILSVIYRQPNIDLKVSKIILMITFPKMKKTIRKQYLMFSNLKIIKKKAEKLLNQMFTCYMIQIIKNSLQ